MKIGVISDTHNFLDPRIPELFEGVEHILHAGDIGLPWIILQLEAIAPVTAVLGNNDEGLDYRETEIITLAGRTFLVHHIVNPTAHSETLRRLITREAPDVIIFGHSHQPFSARHGKIFYFNPGYAGKPRFRLERSVAILHCDADGIRHEFLPL